MRFVPQVGQNRPSVVMRRRRGGSACRRTPESRQSSDERPSYALGPVFDVVARSTCPTDRRRAWRCRLGHLMELGLNLPYVEGSMDGRTPRWSDIRAMAQTAEAIGFEALWVSDHVGFGDPGGRVAGRLGVMDVALGPCRLDDPRGARTVCARDAAPEPGIAREDGRDARRGQRRTGDPRRRRGLERAGVHAATGSRSRIGSGGSRTGCASSPTCSAAGDRPWTGGRSARARPDSSRAGHGRMAFR